MKAAVIFALVGQINASWSQPCVCDFFHNYNGAELSDGYTCIKTQGGANHCYMPAIGADYLEGCNSDATPTECDTSMDSLTSDEAKDCPATCFGYTCDAWVEWGSTCSIEEDDWGCNCAGCGCVQEPESASESEEESDTCSDECPAYPGWASDGWCDDGGVGAEFDGCDFGTDCSDCGDREGQEGPFGIGTEGCPCVGSAGASDGSTWSTEIGNYCRPWDSVEPATYCHEGGTSYGADWCDDDWCYVNPSNCDTPTYSSTYFPEYDLYVSYHTCDTDFVGNTWVGFPSCECEHFHNFNGAPFEGYFTCIKHQGGVNHCYMPAVGSEYPEGCNSDKTPTQCDVAASSSLEEEEVEAPPCTDTKKKKYCKKKVKKVKKFCTKSKKAKKCEKSCDLC